MPHFKFSDNVTGETVEVSEGWAKLGQVDVSHHGREAGVHYGDLDPAHMHGQSVTVNITAQRFEGNVPRGPEFIWSGFVDHGEGSLRHWGEGVQRALPHLKAWADWYTKPAIGAGIPASVLAKQYKLGPDPDELKTESTGSGRLHANRCPYTVAALLDPTQDPGEADRWTEEQGRRTLNYYDSRNGYAPYQANPAHYMGQGYGATTGEFGTSYSAKLPEGVTWSKAGWPVPHATHLTIDGLLAAAYLYGDQMALRQAIGTIQAVGTSLLRGEKWTSRAFGRFFRSCAELAPAIAHQVPGTENIPALVAKALEVLEMRNQGGAPAPDNGATAEGGHLTGDKVFKILGPLGWDKATCQEIGRSDNVWMVAQLASGLMALEELWGRYNLLGLVDDIRVRSQLDLAAKWIAKCGSACLDLDGGMSQAPSKARFGYYDDASTYPTPHTIAEGGKSDNFAYGVGIRFLVPVLAELAGFYGEQKWWNSALPIYDFCKAAGNFNGDYDEYILEALPVLSRTGWDGGK